MPAALTPWSPLGREHAVEGDDVVEGQIGLHVVVRHVAARVLERLRVEVGVGARPRDVRHRPGLGAGGRGRYGARRDVDLARGRRVQQVVAGRQLALADGDALHAGLLAQDIGAAAGQGPLVHRHPSQQIRQVEGGLAVAAVGGADQLVERLVFRDRDGLAAAERPAHRREFPANSRISPT